MTQLLNNFIFKNNLKVAEVEMGRLGHIKKKNSTYAASCDKCVVIYFCNNAHRTLWSIWAGFIAGLSPDPMYWYMSSATATMIIIINSLFNF